MLVIRRRRGESILIGDNIEVEVVEVAAGKVKLGITAPREITVLRKEIRLTSEQNKMAAAGLSAEAIRRFRESMGQDQPHPDSAR